MQNYGSCWQKTNNSRNNYHRDLKVGRNVQNRNKLKVKKPQANSSNCFWDTLKSLGGEVILPPPSPLGGNRIKIFTTPEMYNIGWYLHFLIALKAELLMSVLAILLVIFLSISKLMGVTIEWRQSGEDLQPPPPPTIILQLQWGPVFSSKVYMINSAFSLSTIVI